ncbi:MAG: LuxR C-terminal-related transcriptional regulator [Anaeroplasmataceae bacterium]
MIIAYSIIFVISLLLPCIFYLCVQKKQNEIWLLIIYICVGIVNLGYLLLSLSKTLEFALIANKIAYFGQVYIILCMFMIISKLCGFKYKNWIIGILIAISTIMFSMVLTTGHVDWYYKSVELIKVDGAVKLVKEYGVLHPLYMVYIIAFFIAMIVVITISFIRNKNTSSKLTGLMLAIVLSNIGIWAVEKIVTWNFEFLSVSYLMSEFVFLFVYWLLQDYVLVSDIPSTKEEKLSVIFVNNEEKKDKAQEILARLPEGTILSTRQLEVLEGILDGKSRKEIAYDLHLSENTVKMHTSSLYKALHVTCREEIYALFK